MVITDNIFEEVGLMQPDMVVVNSILERLCDKYGTRKVAMMLGIHWNSVYRWREGINQVSRSHGWQVVALGDMAHNQLESMVKRRVERSLTGKY